jgi:hypothetical protein
LATRSAACSEQFVRHEAGKYHENAYSKYSKDIVYHVEQKEKRRHNNDANLAPQNVPKDRAGNDKPSHVPVVMFF